MTKTAILNQEERLYNAMLASDIAELDELLHDDLLFVIPSGDVVTKHMDLQSYRDGSMKIHQLTPTVERINQIDDLAVVTLTMELKGSYQNQEFQSKLRYIRFWKMSSTGIKVVGGSGTIINA